MSSPARGRRTRTGCLTCRARKIKCDESAAVCNNCTRSGLGCVPSGDAHESLSQSTRSRLEQNSHPQFTQAGTRRRRIKRSCAACKSAKKRCDGRRPRCVRCSERHQGCVYDYLEGDRRPCESSSAADHSSMSPHDAAVASPPFPMSLGSPQAGGLSFLPDRAQAVELCEVFFDEIAPLRCLGFLHRYTFLQDAQHCSLETNPDPLLLSVCALASKTAGRRELWDAGCNWARTAQGLVLADLQNISVRKLMCIVLLYEHAARISDHRLCFMLSGLASRCAQALSLNLEYDHDVLSTSGLVAPVERESRRRLMWACYMIDTMVACGLNHLQTIDSTTIQIQLPCDDKYFLYKVARVTAKVPVSFDSASRTTEETRVSTDNQDIHAFLIRLFLIREHILRYINDHTDEDDPWRLTSALADLEDWNGSLPPELQFNSDVIVIRKEQSMLSALISLHVQYHQINCLLYRCTIPSMLFPARAQTGLSKKASVGFLSESRRGWFDHACAMSTIFEVALDHRPASMTDPAVAGSAYNAIIIKFLYLTNFVPPEERLATMESILPLVNTDLRFLQELHSYHPCVRFPHSAAEHLVEEAKIRIAQDPTVTLSESGNLTGIMSFPTESVSLDHRTNPLSTIAQMRRDLPDVHAPDRVAVPLSRDAQSPGEPERLWVWI